MTYVESYMAILILHLLFGSSFSGVFRWYDLFSKINVTSGTDVGDFHNDLNSRISKTGIIINFQQTNTLLINQNSDKMT